MAARRYVDCPEGLPKITPKWLKEGSWHVRSKLHEPMPATLHMKPPFDPSGKRINGEYEDFGAEQDVMAAVG